MMPLPPLLLRLLAAAGAATAALPAANFSRVPISVWCGNQTGPLSAAAARAFALRPLVVFEKDMAQSVPPVGEYEELKIAHAAEQLRKASATLRPDGPATQVLMYSTVGSLLPQYALSEWFNARPSLMLHDDAGRLVTLNYSLGCPSHRAHQPCGAPVAVPWVDFSQPAAANGWVDGLYKWVENRSVDGVALDGNPFDDEWIVSVGGSPGILANVSSASKRAAFLAGLNASEARLGKKIAAVGGVLMANGVHKSGDNGMLFEEWCEEHSYLRRAKGCNGSSSAVACDMAILQQYSSNPMNVALVHIPDGGANLGGSSGGGVEAQRAQQVVMSESGVLKLAAFLWAAGPRAFFADVPPLKGEKAHWQCDEWAAMPKFAELEKPLGTPISLGTQPKQGLYVREFGGAAEGSGLPEERGGGRSRVVLELGDTGEPKGRACITWADGSRSLSGDGSAALCNLTLF